MTDTTKPTVSIGMPVYNGAKYIKEALDSLLAQTYTDFELIISDNASTDSTQAICEEYASKDSRIRYIRQPENMGPLKNFQFVLDEAVSEYFMWAAHDDVWSENWIEVLHSELDKESLSIGVYGKLIHIDDKSMFFSHIANSKKLEYKGLLRRLKYYIEPESLGKANLFYSIFRKNILKKLDLNKMEYDFQGLYSLLKYGNFVQNKNCSLKKRVHTESLAPLIILKNKQTLSKKLLRIISYPITNINFLLNSYLKKSNIYERILLIVLYPLKIIYIFLILAKNKIR
jgi:glycosyltransferase involved in cell wall biosynthesis